MKIIINNWLQRFPKLKQYKSSTKLIRKYEFVLFGIEVENYKSGFYRPKFVLYSLLEPTNIFYLVIDQSFSNKNQVPLSVNFKNHEIDFYDIGEIVERDSFIDIHNSNVTIENICDGIFKYIEKNQIGTPFYSCKTLMYLSKFIPEIGVQKLVYNKALNILRKEPMESLEYFTGSNIDSWESKIRNYPKEELLNNVEKNIAKYKLYNF